MKLTNTKKKIIAYIITLTLLAIIARIPTMILEYVDPNPNITNKNWMYTIIGCYVYAIYLFGIVNLFYNPIYKFIKLKLFPM